ncbi:hypothetical protein EJD97_012377 [Solanum chilense]|uniref:Uncharacterized protein n=1 Tax=Solanum chilense TaxID=4083 RepID=A0A6N2CA41_SOLCI|nr:hypothetical protein EJD97_012377 [Solanum chilense]
MLQVDQPVASSLLYQVEIGRYVDYRSELASNLIRTKRGLLCSLGGGYGGPVDCPTSSMLTCNVKQYNGTVRWLHVF